MLLRGQVSHREAVLGSVGTCVMPLGCTDLV